MDTNKSYSVLTEIIELLEPLKDLRAAVRFASELKNKIDELQKLKDKLGAEVVDIDAQLDAKRRELAELASGLAKEEAEARRALQVEFESIRSNLNNEINQARKATAEERERLNTEIAGLQDKLDMKTAKYDTEIKELESRLAKAQRAVQNTIKRLQE